MKEQTHPPEHEAEKREDVIESLARRGKAQEIEKDELAVEEVVTRFVEALNRNDMEALTFSQAVLETLV